MLQDKEAEGGRMKEIESLTTLNWELCLAYLDDAIRCLHECIEYLNKALGNLREIKMGLSQDKLKCPLCEFTGTDKELIDHLVDDPNLPSEIANAYLGDAELVE